MREERITTRAVVIKRAAKETRARLKEEEREDRKETKRMLKEAETKGPLDTEEAENQRRWRVKTRRSGKRKSEEEENRRKWRNPFAEAYEEKVMKRRQYGGQLGPLDLYSRRTGDC